MRILVIAVMLQTAVLLLLFSKTVTLEDKLNLAVSNTAKTYVSDDVRDAGVPGVSARIQSIQNEEALRQILREELRAELDRGEDDRVQDEPTHEIDSGESAASSYQRELVAQRLEHYASVGSISDADMSKLQLDIARLDEEGRTEMLRELSRALNSGRLNGRL